MRPIDGDALQKVLDETVFTDSTCPIHIAAAISQAIDLAPVVDVTQVRGTWTAKSFQTAEGSIKSGWMCSVCRSIQLEKPDRCPNCKVPMWQPKMKEVPHE